MQCIPKPQKRNILECVKSSLKEEQKIDAIPTANSSLCIVTISFWRDSKEYLYTQVQML